MSGYELNGLLTPPEVQHQRLRKRLGAYRVDDVDALLERVAASYESVWLDRDDARRRIEQLESDLGRYREIEEMLRETLAEARRSMDRMREEAAREAEATIMRARVRADAILEDARLELRRHEMTVDELRAVSRSIAERIRLALAASAAEVERILGDDPAVETVGERAAGEARAPDVAAPAASA